MGDKALYNSTLNIEYMYIFTLNDKKKPKCVKMITSKWHRKEENLFTHYFRYHKCIQFVSNNFYCRKQWGRAGGILGSL